MANRNRQATGRRKRQGGGLPEDPEQRRRIFREYVLFLEGLADYSKVGHSYGENPNDHREVGWTIGRQIVSLYLIEMLLRIDHELRGDAKGANHHNLARLFRRLPDKRRAKVERTYRLILNSRVEWTWDVYRTVGSFLDFHGANPITGTRYPWSQQKDTHYSPGDLMNLVDALYIALHDYPVKAGALDKRFDTEFRSLAETKRNSPGSRGNQSGRGKGRAGQDRSVLAGTAAGA